MQGQSSYLKLSGKQISILLTIVSLLLWSHSILNARLEIGFLGLIHGLPITFFIALACLAIASTMLWVSKERHGKLLCLQLLILVSALWLIPTVTGGSPPVVSHDYRNIGLIDHIAANGYFSNEVTGYFSWPGAFITSAITTMVSLINIENLVGMGLMPFLMQLLCLAPLYIFLKNTLGEERSNYCWLGCWLFYLAEWVFYLYLGPPGFAFFFLLTLLALVTNPKIWQKETKRAPFFIITMAIFAALTVTHLLTSLAVLCVLIGLFLLKRDKRMAFAIVACIVLLAAWNLTEASLLGSKIKSSEGFVTIGETANLENPPRTMLVLNPKIITEIEVTERMSGSQSHNTIARIRLLFSSIFALFGLAGAILVCLIRRNLKTGIPLLIISLAPLILLSLSYQFGNELLPRIYLFALPGMAYFGAMLLDMKSRILPLILCLVLIFCCPLHVISRYGSQELDYISSGELSGVNFFHDRAIQSYVIGAWPLGKLRDLEMYRPLSLKHTDCKTGKLTIEGRTDEGMPCYIGISRHIENRFDWFKGDSEIVANLKEVVSSNTNYDFIYNNMDMKLYLSENLER